jgi:uncharacterized protein (TIGR03067 family)
VVLLMLAILASSLVPIQLSDEPSQTAEGLAGTWKIVSATNHGNVKADLPIDEYQVKFTADKLSVHHLDKVRTSYRIKIYPARDPKAIDLEGIEGDSKGEKHVGIYEIKEGKLKMCTNKGTERPTGFRTAQENEWAIIVLKRKN